MKRESKKPTEKEDGAKKPKRPPNLREKDIVDRLNASSQNYGKAVKRILKDSGVEPEETKY